MRRAGLVALLLILAAPARALDCAAAVPLLFPGDAAAIADATDLSRRRCAVARVGDGPDAPWIAAAVRGYDRLAVALLRVEADGSVRVVAGPVEIEALATEPFHAVVVEVVPARSFGGDTVAVTVVNGFLSSGRSTATTALHLFRRRGDALLPAFATYLAAEHAGNARCPGQRAGPPDLTCRVYWSRTWRVEAARPAGRGADALPPDLLVRDARTRRVLSRHRWAGEAYVPPFFDGLPSFGEE